MILYFSPFACSQTAHILAREVGIDLQLEPVNLREKTLADGSDYRKINPAGQVPALRLDNGTLLTEGTAIAQYLTDLKPELGLAPASGSIERYQMQAWLSFLSSEIHKHIVYPIVWGADHLKQNALAAAPNKWAIAEQGLKQRDYLVTHQFTAADAYLTWLLNIGPHVGLDLSPYTNLNQYHQRMIQRPSVISVLKHETALLNR